MRSFLDEISKFREFLYELGVGQAALALPAPKTLALLPSEGANPQTLFSTIITEIEIASVSRDLFASGHFSLAVQEALKALEKYLQRRTGKRASGTSLMEQVFSANKPALFWSEQLTQSEKDEHIGYMRIYVGVMQGIRNPCTHEFNWIDDAETALEAIAIAQHLLRKAKQAQPT